MQLNDFTRGIDVIADVHDSSDYKGTSPKGDCCYERTFQDEHMIQRLS